MKYGYGIELGIVTGRGNMRSALFVVGLSFVWPLFRRDGMGLLFGSNFDSVYVARLYFLIYLMMVVGFSAAVYVLRHRIRPFVVEKEWSVLLVSATASAGAFVFSAANLFSLQGESAVLIFSAVLYALWTAIAMPVWAFSASDYSPKRVSILVLASFISSYILTLTGLVSGNFKYFVPVFGPIASGICWVLFFRKANVGDDPDVVDLNGMPLKRITVLLMFLLLGGVIRGFLNNGSIVSDPGLDMLVTHSISIVVAIAVYGILLSGRDIHRGYGRIWRVLILCLLAGLLIVAFLVIQDSSVYIGRSLVIASRTCLVLLFWLVLMSVSSHKPLTAFVLFGMVFTAGEAVSLILSYIVVPAVAIFLAVPLSDSLIPCVLISIFVMLLGVFVLADEEIDSLRKKGDSSDALKLCQALSSRYGLTRRETEVMALMSKGYDVKRISEELYLSVNTVQSYSKSLYRKLGVHRKQEIIDMVMNGNG